MKAIAIIKEEHRRLGAILYTLNILVQEIEKSGKNVPFRAFHGLIYYLDSFLDRYHHPKESEHLFPAVMRRHPPAREIVEKLGKEHGEGERLLGDMLRALSAYEFLGDVAFKDFRDSVERYVTFERAHAQLEERELLPLAVEHLSDDDWRTIDEVFTAHDDPLFGDRPTAEFGELLASLSQQVPAPYGLGPE